MPPKVAQMIKVQEEQKIFKEFERLGWKVIYRYKQDIDLVDSLNKRISIYFIEQSYFSTATLTMKEHQLLHRLFEIWGWLE